MSDPHPNGPNDGAVLIFGTNTEGDTIAKAKYAAAAGRWASERGYYRLAQQLHGLACVLYDLEDDAWQATTERPARTVNVPLRGATRDEQPTTEMDRVVPLSVAARNRPRTLEDTVVTGTCTHANIVRNGLAGVAFGVWMCPDCGAAVDWPFGR